MIDLLILITLYVSQALGVFFVLVSALFWLEIVLYVSNREPVDSALVDLKDGNRFSSIILIPAHNEEDVIHLTISSLQSHLTEKDQIVVVADNCTDSTIAICQSLGVRVVERYDNEFKGKSYALDFGRSSIELSQRDVIFNIDADCDCSLLDIGQMKALAYHSQRPVQCYYEMQQTDKNTLSARLSAFAWWIRNHVRATGAMTMGIPCQLMGSGMAFPSNVFKKIDFSSNALAEDLQIGLQLSQLKHFPIYLSSSKVISYLPTTTEASDVQKTRWVHGHIAAMFDIAFPTLAKSLIQHNWRCFWQSIDALFPPITLTVPVLAVMILLTALIPGTALPFILFSVSLTLVTSGLCIAYLSDDNRYVDTNDLFKIPFLMIKMFYIPISYFVNKQTSWEKTKRDE